MSQKVPMSRFVAWTVALRTRIIDDYVTSGIAAGVDTVLNLGAGLDARPYRMSLPPALRWIEADFARIIEYKDSIAGRATALSTGAGEGRSHAAQ